MNLSYGGTHIDPSHADYGYRSISPYTQTSDTADSEIQIDGFQVQLGRGVDMGQGRASRASGLGPDSLDANRIDGNGCGAIEFVDALAAESIPGLCILVDREEVVSLLAALPDVERNVLLMRIFHAQPQTRIAERLGITPDEVSELLSKTLAALRDQLL